VKLCTKNYENPSIFVKVTAKKSVAPYFFLDTVYKSDYLGGCERRLAYQHWLLAMLIDDVIASTNEGELT